MGLFDTFIIDLKKLPISQKERKEIRKLKIKDLFQTKDFENILTIIRVTKDDQLQIKKSEYESVPIEKRPLSSKGGIHSLIGSIKEVNIRYEDLNFTGYFNFYGTFQILEMKNWYEFKAYAKNGKIEFIERII